MKSTNIVFINPTTFGPAMAAILAAAHQSKRAGEDDYQLRHMISTFDHSAGTVLVAGPGITAQIDLVVGTDGNQLLYGETLVVGGVIEIAKENAIDGELLHELEMTGLFISSLNRLRPAATMFDLNEFGQPLTSILVDVMVNVPMHLVVDADMFTAADVDDCLGQFVDAVPKLCFDSTVVDMTAASLARMQEANTKKISATA